MKKILLWDPLGWEPFLRRACSRLKSEAAHARARQADPWRRKMTSLAVGARYSAKARAVRHVWRKRCRDNWTWTDLVKQANSDIRTSYCGSIAPPWKKFATQKATLATLRSRLWTQRN